MKSHTIYFPLFTYKQNIMFWLNNTLWLSLARVDRSCPSNLVAMDTRLELASTAVTSRPSPNDRNRVKWPYDEIRYLVDLETVQKYERFKTMTKNYIEFYFFVKISYSFGLFSFTSLMSHKQECDCTEYQHSTSGSVVLLWYSCFNTVL